MLKFIIKRLLLIIPISLGMSFLVFLLLRLGPVDPATAYLLHSRIPISPEALLLTEQELGLDQPILVQYIQWLEGAVQLDFGISFTAKSDVLKTLLYYLPNTLLLTFLSMLVVLCISLPLGIFAAIKKNSLFDKGVKFFSFLGVSIPSFWLGFMLLYFFSIKLELLPPFGNEGWASYIMPIITLSFMSVAINTRLTRVSFLEHLNTPSTQYLHLSNLNKKKIYGKYTLKNSMLPIVTSLGMHFGELLGGAFIVETLFALPGIGRFMVGALYSHDFPVIQCFMCLMLLLFLTINLISDIIYAYLNPKIRYDNPSNSTQERTQQNEVLHA